MFQKTPIHTSYKDDKGNEIDHSLWWLWFIITWTEKTDTCCSNGKGCC